MKVILFWLPIKRYRCDVCLKKGHYFKNLSLKDNIQILDNPKVPGGVKIPMAINTDVITLDK
jgi:hypothetical protein